MKEEKQLHFDILNNRQKFVLKNLFPLKKYDFYLAGGTALALQIGHRRSLDFDFYSLKSFDSRKLLEEIRKNFKEVRVINQEEDTFLVVAGGINLSFFFYPYPLLKPLIRINNINIASLEDIAAMKIIAIIQRKTRRDYIDIFCLLKEIGLEKILNLVKKKYKKLYGPYLALRALVYFDDIEPEKSKLRENLLADFEWEEVKKEVLKIVKDFKKKQLSTNKT